MGELILVTGGARSGKSAFAEMKVTEFGQNVTYIATAKPADDEMLLRVEKHKKQRPSNWKTVEIFSNMVEKIKELNIESEAILLDCVTIMVSNIFFENDVDWNALNRLEIESIEKKLDETIHEIICELIKLPVPIVVVTNELGMGIVPDNKLSRIYRDVAGKANQAFAEYAKEVYFCVSGIPMCIKKQIP